MPSVAALIAVPLPLRTPLIEVESVIAGVVEGVATLPANPFAETTEVVVTVPVVGVCHVAAVLLVAVRTCPVLGAAAATTSTSVVADFKTEALTALAAELPGPAAVTSPVSAVM